MNDRTKIWFDTEFIEDGRTIDLISIGMVREDGATYYAEFAECDFSKASDWVVKNVIPHLRCETKPRSMIAAEIIEFAGNAPEFWAYYADYDWVALCQLYGTMMNLPKGWPMYCLDIRQAAHAIGNPRLPPHDSFEHYALADARWARKAWEYLATRPPPAVSGWAATEPSAEREMRMNAWQAFRSCRDCNFWHFDEEVRDSSKPCIGPCGHPRLAGLAAAFLVPEDFTCTDFERKVTHG